MQRQPVTDAQRDRILGSLSFVESLARRVASSMPHSIDLGDLVQDGMLGLIDAAREDTSPPDAALPDAALPDPALPA